MRAIWRYSAMVTLDTLRSLHEHDHHRGVAGGGGA
jgi:hypothetical protein